MPIEEKGDVQDSLYPIVTGFSQFDSQLGGGLEPGDLMVIGGRPFAGTTSLAMGIARHNLSELGVPTLWLSFDMRYDEFMKRFISTVSAIPLHKYHKFHLLNSEELERLTSVCAQVFKMPFYFEMPLNLEEAVKIIRDHINFCKDNDGWKEVLVIIDDIDLAVSPRKHVGIPHFLKQTAVNLNVPIIVTSCLNECPESRRNTRPLISDLGMKDIEEFADIISLLYRDERYNPYTPNKGFAEIILAKNKAGVASTLKLRIDPNTATFNSL